MFTSAWFKREIEGLEAQQAQLIVQLHNVDGAINVLKQMKQALNAEDGLPLEEFVEANMPGAMIESIDPIEEANHED
jgi:hypothetical protein